MFRDTRKVSDDLLEADTHLTQALLADDTREISTESSIAQVKTLEALHRLKADLENEDANDVSRTLIQSAINSLDLAWTHAEKVALGTDVRTMREELLPFKTNLDYAAAFLRASLGSTE
jgi:hypothetical protein